MQHCCLSSQVGLPRQNFATFNVQTAESSASNADNNSSKPLSQSKFFNLEQATSTRIWVYIWALFAPIQAGQSRSATLCSTEHLFQTSLCQNPKASSLLTSLDFTLLLSMMLKKLPLSNCQTPLEHIGQQNTTSSKISNPRERSLCCPSTAKPIPL